MSTGFPDYLSGFQQPSSLYVSPNDVLRLAAATSQAAETITVNYRILNAARQIVRGQATISPASTRAVTTVDVTLPEGFLLSLSAKAAVALTPGATFLRAFLTDSTIGLGQPSFMIIASYVTTRMCQSYPNGRILDPTEGVGGLTEAPVANPAAGADWSYTVPTNAVYEILALYQVLACDANPANRYPLIAVNYGTGNAFRTGTTVALAAGANISISAAPGSAFVADNVNSLQLSLPQPLLLRGGDRIGSVTPGIQVGDQYSAIAIRVRDWLENV